MQQSHFNFSFSLPYYQLRMLLLALSEAYWNNTLFKIASFTNVIMIIPVITALLFIKNWNKPLTIFFYYLCLVLFLNYFESIFVWASGEFYNKFEPFLTFWEISNSIFLQILFYINNFILLGLFYNSIFPNYQFKNSILYLSLFLTAIAIINYAFIEGYQELGILNPFLNATYVAFLPIFYLWNSQKQSLRISLRKSPYFLISIGLFLPKIIGFFLYFTGDFFLKNDFVTYCKLGILKNIFTILGQILIAIGFAHSYYARFIKINK